MTALTLDVIRVFFAVVVFAAILTIALVIIANTTDVDSMADPAPRPGERCICTNCGHIHPGPACHWCNCTNLSYPLTSGQEIDSRQPRRSGRAPAEGPVPDSAARLSGPGGSRCEPIADEAGPHVPDDVMRIIDAALPREQVNARHLHFVEDVKQ